jgi:hypothetical protein
MASFLAIKQPARNKRTLLLYTTVKPYVSNDKQMAGDCQRISCPTIDEAHPMETLLQLTARYRCE